MTLIWSSSNSSRRKFFTVWTLNASGHKLIASQQYMSGIYGFLRLAWTCEPTCESVWPPFASLYASSGFANLCRLVSPFGHPSQVCTQVLVLQTCVDLRIRLATLRKSVRKFWFCKLVSTCESVWPGLLKPEDFKNCQTIPQGVTNLNKSSRWTHSNGCIHFEQRNIAEKGTETLQRHMDHLLKGW